jgi:hypothetical protein
MRRCPPRRGGALRLWRRGSCARATGRWRSRIPRCRRCRSRCPGRTAGKTRARPAGRLKALASSKRPVAREGQLDSVRGDARRAGSPLRARPCRVRARRLPTHATLPAARTHVPAATVPVSMKADSLRAKGKSAAPEFHHTSVVCSAEEPHQATDGQHHDDVVRPPFLPSRRPARRTSASFMPGDLRTARCSARDGVDESTRPATRMWPPGQSHQCHDGCDRLPAAGWHCVGRRSRRRQ